MPLKDQREQRRSDNSAFTVVEGDSLYSKEYQKAIDFILAGKVDEVIAVYENLLNKDTTTGAAYGGSGACYIIEEGI